MPKLASNRQHEHVARWFFVIVGAAILFVFWKIIAPFALVLLASGVMAVVMSPIEKWLRLRTKSARIASLLTLALVLLAIVGPLTLAAFLVVDQALGLLQNIDGIRAWIGTFSLESYPLYQLLPSAVQQRVDAVDLSAVLSAIAGWAASNIDTLFSSTAEFIFKTFIFFICLYFFLVDRERIVEQMLALSPFRDQTDRRILARMALTVRAVVSGSLIVAFVQGVLAGIGMTIFGVPGAMLWAAIVVIAANVPFIGTAGILIPAVLYLLLVGNVTGAIGLLVWATLVVGLVDNFLKPYLVEGKTRMHPLLILLSILGGLQVFGPIGLIVGPTVLATLLAFLEMYKAGVLEQEQL